MEQKYIDTNIILRLLTTDDPTKQEASAALFERIENKELVVYAPDLVIAEVVYVLSSPKHYNKSHEEVRSLLFPLLSLENFKVANRKALLRALDLYAVHPIDFSDVFMKATMEENNAHLLYSYDTDFDRFPDLTRKDPVQETQKAA
jgi:predicted nucleic acid-binding protein